MDSPYTHRCAICGARHTYRTAGYNGQCCSADGRFHRPIGETPLDYAVSVKEAAESEPPEPDLDFLL